METLRDRLDAPEELLAAKPVACRDAKVLPEKSNPQAARFAHAPRSFACQAEGDERWQGEECCDVQYAQVIQRIQS